MLKRLFAASGPAPIEAIVRAAPTGAYARRIWFLYEWLTGRRLGLPNADRGAYPLVVDPKRQYAAAAVNSSRYRVKNNLPGTPEFCPLVSRTERLDRFIALDLRSRAQDAAAAVPPDLRARAAAFLLLDDSRASYAIEGERPPQDRIQRWGHAIGQAGKQPLDLDELCRLQRVVIGDARFVSLGLRNEGGFVGERDRETQQPIPSHVSARPEDLQPLVDGLVAFDRQATPRARRGVDGRRSGFRLCLHPPLRRRERQSAPLPDTPRLGGERLQSSRCDVSRLSRDSGPDPPSTARPWRITPKDYCRWSIGNRPKAAT